MAFQPKPVYVINVYDLLNEEEYKILKSDIKKELGDQFRVIINLEIHKLAPKQRYLDGKSNL